MDPGWLQSHSGNSPKSCLPFKAFKILEIEIQTVLEDFLLMYFDRAFKEVFSYAILMKDEDASKKANIPSLQGE